VGQRSRKRSAVRATPAPQPTEAPRGYARTRAKDDAVRAELEPYGPGERPVAVVIAALLATALALANVIALVAGVTFEGKHPSALSVLIFAAVMLAAAVGLLRMRYWAILGFEALLALIVLVFALLLVRASNVSAVVVALVVIPLGSWLFWKLVRVMARVQIPQRRVS
jgi:hypothetical protein